MTLRRCSRVSMMIATMAVTTPKSFCSVDCASICAVTPPSRLPAAVATSSSMPRRMLISCLPARAADTELDVAMTVVRLIAAATGEREVQDEVEERHQQHAAADAEQRAETARRRRRPRR